MVLLIQHNSDEDNAESTCETCLQNALNIDPSNTDALQCLANLRILRERDTEASELLDKVLEQVLSESK
jgi:Tfp pilus assembly protein PilF